MSALINPYMFSAVSPYSATLTVASGAVSSDLTNFPVMVRLSGMPAKFWTNVRSDGGDIRVTTAAGVAIPFDLVRFDYVAKDGVLFFKAPTVAAASATQWKITCGYPSLSKLTYTDANGRNAVWADYASVLLFGETSDDRTGTATYTSISNNGDPDQFSIVETSPSLGGTMQVQGICWDGTYYYIAYTGTTNARIEKRDASWSLVAQNAAPLTDTGDAAINHLGDMDCRNGFLYIALQNWNGTVESAERIGIWRTSDLGFVTKFDVSAQHPGCSGITYCTKDNLLYVCSYTDGTKLWKFDPGTGAYVGTLTFSFGATTMALQLQGVQWWRDAFWLNSDAFDETFRCDYSGNVSVSGLFGQDVSSGGGEYEGLGANGDGLVVVQSIVSGGVTSYYAKRYMPIDLAKAAGGGITPYTSADYVKISGRPALTTYTLGATVSFSATTGANRTPVSYWNAAVDNSRQSIAFRSSSNNLAIWDVNNSWLESSPAINPTLNQSYRIHAVYQGTTGRRLYVDGAQKNAQTTITALPSTLTTLNLLREDDTAAEPFSGKLGFVYLRGSALSAAWIAAEHANLNSPSTFYTVVDG